MKTPSWFLKRNFIAYALLPFSWIYFLASKLVYFFRCFCIKCSTRLRQGYGGQERPARLRPPALCSGATTVRQVICIGNILAGGVGKTPVVSEVAKKLSAPVIMRGYKGGDEAKMLKKAGIEVYIGNRQNNIKKLSAISYQLSAIIMDDGFQNPTIKKALSILVFDEKIGVGNGFMLPAGPLREPLSAIRRADAVMIIRKRDEGRRMQALESALKKYGKPIFYATSETIMPDTNKKIIAFAGIGYPQKFFDAVRPFPIETIAFPDHYQYTASDLKKLFARAEFLDAELLTTEKDWVRLPDFAARKIKVAKQKVLIEHAFWKWLKKKLNEERN